MQQLARSSSTPGQVLVQDVHLMKQEKLFQEMSKICHINFVLQIFDHKAFELAMLPAQSGVSKRGNRRSSKLALCSVAAFSLLWYSDAQSFLSVNQGRRLALTAALTSTLSLAPELVAAQEGVPPKTGGSLVSEILRILLMSFPGPARNFDFEQPEFSFPKGNSGRVKVGPPNGLAPMMIQSILAASETW